MGTSCAGRVEEGERTGDTRMRVEGGGGDGIKEGKEVAVKIGAGSVAYRSPKSSAVHVGASLGVPNGVLRRLETYDVGTRRRRGI